MEQKELKEPGRMESNSEGEMRSIICGFVAGFIFCLVLLYILTLNLNVVMVRL